MIWEVLWQWTNIAPIHIIKFLSGTITLFQYYTCVAKMRVVLFVFFRRIFIQTALFVWIWSSVKLIVLFIVILVNTHYIELHKSFRNFDFQFNFTGNSCVTKMEFFPLIISIHCHKTGEPMENPYGQLFLAFPHHTFPTAHSRLYFCYNPWTFSINFKMRV